MSVKCTVYFVVVAEYTAVKNCCCTIYWPIYVFVTAINRFAPVCECLCIDMYTSANTIRYLTIMFVCLVLLP